MFGVNGGLLGSSIGNQKYFEGLGGLAGLGGFKPPPGFDG
jgi:hypothetical protein